MTALDRNLNGWTVIKELSGGGQSDVYLVRNPKRSTERAEGLLRIRTTLNSAGIITGMHDVRDAQKLADSIWESVRPETSAEIGALKVFKIPETLPLRNVAIERLKNEIAALGQDIPGLPRLLDSNEGEGWIVTEYFPQGSLRHNLSKFRGRVIPALKAFRSVVLTVTALHAKGYVHRDIKPHNVFVRDDELVLGDFGIVFMPDEDGRVTMPLERVGPRDYMPPWTNLGERDEEVRASSDIYMLGKLLWTLVDGRIFLPYQYQHHPKFDLVDTFPGDPGMYVVNQIIDNCVVEHEHQCTITARELLNMIDVLKGMTERGGQLLHEDVPRPCHVCGRGFYQPQTRFSNIPPSRPGDSLGVQFWPSGGTGSGTGVLPVHPFACDVCGNLQLFTLPAPRQNC